MNGARSNRTACLPFARMGLVLSTLAISTSAAAADFTLGETQVSVGGYVKIDALYSRFSDGSVPSNSAGRDFFIPGLTPVSDGGGRSHTYLDLHARETRLSVTSARAVGDHVLGGHVEVDFLVNPGNVEKRLANGSSLSLRRAFMTYRGWTLGQDWSTFQNLVAVPETLNFVPWPPEGTVFARQALVRYSFDDFDVALENPTMTVTAPTGDRLVSDSSYLPDAVARYRFTYLDGRFTLSGIARQLRLDGSDTEPVNGVGAKDTAIGYGASLAGVVPYHRGDIRFTVTAGEGLGRYVALNAVSALQIEGGDVETIRTLSGFVALRYEWTSQWRSTFTLAAFGADHDVALTGGGVTKRLRGATVNLLYSPVTVLTFGVEARFSDRELEDGRDGSLTRLQFSAKYAFL